MPPGSAKVVETSLGEAGIYYFFSLTIIREERGGAAKSGVAMKERAVSIKPASSVTFRRRKAPSSASVSAAAEAMKNHVSHDR